MLKARDIEDILRARNFEKGTLYVLQVLAEQHREHHSKLYELASYFDQMVSSMDGMLTIAGNMKDVLQKLDKREDDLPPNTHMLGN